MEVAMRWDDWKTLREKRDFENQCGRERIFNILMLG
jgi:hypothetical protein